jgi:hypothetical protein
MGGSMAGGGVLLLRARSQEPAPAKPGASGPKRCRGFLHADGYAGFRSLYTPAPTNGIARGQPPRLPGIRSGPGEKYHNFLACRGEDRPADATQMRAAANMVKRVDEDSLSVEPSSSVVFDIVETTFCPR